MATGDKKGETTPETAAPTVDPKENKNLEERIERSKRLVASLKTEKEALESIAKTQEEINELKEKEEKLARAEIQLQRELLKQQRELGIITEDQYKDSIRSLKANEKKIDLMKKEREEIEKLDKGWWKLTQAQSLNLAGMGKLMQNYGEGSGGLIGFLRASAMVTLDKLAEAFTNVANAQKEAAVAGYSLYDNYAVGTHGMSKFLGVARDTNGELQSFTKFGIGFKELQDAENGLRDSMVGFSDATAENKDMMKANAAQMKNLGVDFGTAGRNYNFLNKSLGLFGKDVVKVNDQLVKTGLAAGISAKKMLTDFSQIGPQLAAQGQKSIQIFSDLAKQAKALGMEVSQLMGTFGSSMDTFEGASSAAGKFNAMMGGDYLNAIQLLNATESERVDIVKRQMDATGKNWATMSKYERIALANTLGIKDLNEASMLFSGNTEEMRKKKEKEAETQERLNKLQQEAVDIGARLSSMFQVVAAVAAPFVWLLDKIASTITWLNDKSKGFAAIVISGALLGGMFLKLRANTEMATAAKIRHTQQMMANDVKAKQQMITYQSLSMKLKQHGMETKLLTDKEKQLAMAYDQVAAAQKRASIKSGLFTLLPMLIMLFTFLHDVLLKPNSPILLDVLTTYLPAAFEAVGRSLQPLIKPMLAFGAAVLMMGGGIFLAAYGIAELVKAFNGLNPDQIKGAVAALAIFGVVILGIIGTLAVLAFSGVGPVAVGLLLAFGAAFLMIGAGIWLAANGMSSFVESIGKLSGGGGAVAATLAKISLSLVGVAAAVGILTLSMFGLMMLGAAGPLGWALLALGVMAVVKSVKTLGEAFNSFPSERSIQFKASTDSLSTVLKDVKALKSEDIKPTIEVIKSAKEYLIQVSSNNKVEDPAVRLLTKILEIATKATKSTTSSTQSSAGSEVYEIKIDDASFGKLIKKHLDRSGVSGKSVAKLSGAN